ncbi:hypothetical protein KFE25_001166 [Diacronema lutheri]|uniref:Uncharacterized protein n=2 Tax=Diacronema lutheri TaxID=2081491 RepID=A0A8J5XD91_DIALT|nr:hypothetical protein KFE25_001166 [Diacronema lutheri]
MANGAADAALRRKLDDLSAAHAEVVAGLSTEVERLQTVAHGLMLQLVLNGLTPQVPTGREFVRALYDQVAGALRRGEAQLPELMLDGAVRTSASPHAITELPRVAPEQVMPAAEPATTPPRISLAPAPERTPAPASTSSLQSVSSAGRRGLLRTSSVPQFARSERQSLPLSPSASSTSSLAARSAGRARPHGDDATRSRRAAADAAAYLMDEERPLASTWSPAGAAMAAAGSGGSAALREEAGLHGAGAAIDLRTTHTPFVASPSDLAAATASAHSNPIGGAGLGSDVPRVLLRKGGGSYSMRKPRNLAPIGATERSALGGFGVRTNRREKAKPSDGPATWPQSALGLDDR